MDPKDKKFQEWLDLVVPSETVRQKVLTAVDWNAILNLLMSLFQILSSLGCFGAARLTGKVKSILAYRSPTDMVPDLTLLLKSYNDKQKGKFLKNLVLILAILPSLLMAKGGIQTDARGHQFLFSQKLQRKLYLGLKHHAKATAKPDTFFKDSGVKVPNDFVMTDKWPLPAGLPLDQGQCGSCVYHSISGNYDYSLSIRGLMPAGSSPLSREQLMNCIPNGGQCDGDYAENVGSGLVGLKGLVPDAAYPYTAQSDSCRSVSAKPIGPIVGGHIIDSSPQSFGSALVMGVPVSTTVGADNTWMNADSSLYTACTNQGTNHEVLIIGIHATGAARGADGFINFAAAKPGDISIDILNSWGPQWADHGVIHTLVKTPSGQLCNNVTEELYVLDTGVPVAKPVDGNWSDFGACVNGVQTRTCSNPAPSNGGKDCVGPSTQVCVVPPVPGQSGIPVLGWIAFIVVGILGGFAAGRLIK